MNNLKYSDVESRRFGKQVFRGVIDKFDIEDFKAFYTANDPDILIVRIPVSEQHKMHQLNSLGKDVINADTLVYYQVDLNNTVYYPILNDDLKFVMADSSHKAIFESLIQQVFQNYTNHYYSNPLLDKKKITEGYMEWVISSLDAPDNVPVLIYKNDVPVAFITCNYNSNCAEIILNGVLPEYQGQKIYPDAIRYVKNYFHKLNIPLLKVSTQIQNFGVQKVWSREGLVLSGAFVTVHLNKK